MLPFFLIEFCKPCAIHSLVKKFGSFLSFLIGAWASNKVPIFDRYWYNLVKKENCGRWSKNVDVTLSYSISSIEVEFEKIPINKDVLEILAGKTIRDNKKLELSIKKIIYWIWDLIFQYYQSHLGGKFLWMILFAISVIKDKQFVKSFTGSVECLYMQPTITLGDFEDMVSIKVDSIFPGS